MPAAQNSGLPGAWRARPSGGRSPHPHREPWKRGPPLASFPAHSLQHQWQQAGLSSVAGLRPHLPHRMTARSRAVPPTAHTSSRTPEPRRAHRGRGPGHPGPTSFPQFKLPAAGEAGSLRAGAWRRGGGRKLGVTLPETPDGPRRGSGLGGRVGIKGAPSSEALGHVTVAGAQGEGEGRYLWRPPAARTRREGPPLSTLPQRQPPHTQPLPPRPVGLAQPGFSIRPGSARQLSGDRADLREQGVSISCRSDKRAGPSLWAPRGRSPAPATPRQTRSRWEQR